MYSAYFVKFWRCRSFWQITLQLAAPSHQASAQLNAAGWQQCRGEASTKGACKSPECHPEKIHGIGVAVGEEELERFERDAECADAHGGTKRSRQRQGLKLEFET